MQSSLGRMEMKIHISCNFNKSQIKKKKSVTKMAAEEGKLSTCVSVVHFGSISKEKSNSEELKKKRRVTCGPRGCFPILQNLGREIYQVHDQGTEQVRIPKPAGPPRPGVRSSTCSLALCDVAGVSTAPPTALLPSPLGHRRPRNWAPLPFLHSVNAHGSVFFFPIKHGLTFVLSTAS